MLCFVQFWLLDQHNNHLLFCQKFSITTNVFLDSCTIFLTVMEITSLKIVYKTCRHTNTKHTLYIFQAKRWLRAKCEIKLFVYFEKKDHTKNLCLICFLLSGGEGWGIFNGKFTCTFKLSNTWNLGVTCDIHCMCTFMFKMSFNRSSTYFLGF